MGYCVKIYNGAKITEEICYIDLDKALDHVTYSFMKVAKFEYKQANEILAESLQLTKEHFSKSFVTKEFRVWEIEDDISIDMIVCIVKLAQ